jgi:hypothetical protein
MSLWGPRNSLFDHLTGLPNQRLVLSITIPDLRPWSRDKMDGFSG